MCFIQCLSILMCNPSKYYAKFKYQIISQYRDYIGKFSLFTRHQQKTLEKPHTPNNHFPHVCVELAHSIPGEFVLC